MVVRYMQKACKMQPYNQDSLKIEGQTGRVPTLDEAISRSQEFFLSKQFPDGFWWGEFEMDASLTAVALLLLKLFGVESEFPICKMETYIRRKQCNHGGWEAFYGDGGDLNVTIHCYIALRLLDASPSDSALKKALKLILSKGGVTQSRMETKILLATLGCFDWNAIPALPSWVMLLPTWFPFCIYDLSSWVREFGVPMIIMLDKKPVFKTTPEACFDELYVEGRKNAPTTVPFQGNWPSYVLVAVDRIFKLMQRWSLVPFRETGMKAAERWVLERQEETGDWAGIFMSLFYSMLSLKIMGFDITDPVMQRGLQGLRQLSIETEDEYWVQASTCPVWNTAFVISSLVESGMAPDDPILQHAGEWLLTKQILRYGDWSFKNRVGYPGGWAFEFFNSWYPDVDDSAAVVMALDAVKLLQVGEDVKQAAIARCLDWISSMQCKAGGWGAFDKDNDKHWLNSTLYADKMKIMIDPNTSDVTARVLEMVGRLKLRNADALPPLGAESIARALAFLRKEQEEEGAWFGRWGVNYIYGTCGAMVAMSLVAPVTHREEMAKGAKWLVGVQNVDGGWGETCCTYDEGCRGKKGCGTASTASQTAWATMGLLAAGDACAGEYEVEAIRQGVEFLLSTQREDGSWHEAQFTGVAFPGHYYSRYHMYAQHFSLTALSRYRSRLPALRN